jgi:hypothetical protein
MSKLEKKHFDAAGAMSEIFATRLGQNRGVHSETAIASAARMAGTMLFRTFGLDTSKMPPGAAVLSNEANEKGPELVNIVVLMMQHYGLQPDREKLANIDKRGEPPRMTVLETQELLEADLTQIRQKYQLNLEEGAHACALTTAWLIRECAPQIGLEVGFNLAAYSFIEGTKTVPRVEMPSESKDIKSPWYRFWK